MGAGLSDLAPGALAGTDGGAAGTAIIAQAKQCSGTATLFEASGASPAELNMAGDAASDDGLSKCRAAWTMLAVKNASAHKIEPT